MNSSIRKSYQHSKRGFTLVEIMIVVVIIGLLAALAIPAFRHMNQKSKETAATNLLREYASAARLYYLEYGVETVNVSELLGAHSYVTVPSHKAFADAELTNGGQITEGVPLVLTGLDIGDVTYDF